MTATSPQNLTQHTFPKNLPPTIGVPGGAPTTLFGVTQYLTQFVASVNGWVTGAANAVNYLLGRVGGSTFYTTGSFGYSAIPAGSTMAGFGFRWGTAHGSKTGTSCVLWNGTVQPPASNYLGVTLQVGTGASPAQGSALTGTTRVAAQYGGNAQTYQAYSMAAIVTWPAADSWFDMGINNSVVNANTLIREYTVSVFDVAL